MTLPEKFILKSELGRGGMATVYLAHDNKFDTNVAIKVLNKEFVHNDNIRKRFLAEAKSMFKMSHPNIIKVNDLIEENDTVAFVMEYIEGETLKEYLDRKGKLNDDEIKTIFSQMLEAVGYVHEQNLVHRDIKPSNFMIDKKGKVKLMDFGIAKTLDPASSEYTQTGTGMQMGTPMYMSPEQIKSTKEVTFSADIYSLGVVLWQMVAGRKPYNLNELSVPEIQVSILREPLTSLKTVWDKIIQKATEKNMDNRFNNCEDFKSALAYQKWIEEETIVVDNQECTIVESLKINDNYENTELENLHIDFFFPLKVKDCFTKIYNEMQAELKYGIDWDVPLTQIDSYNWYYPETMPDDFGIIGFSKNNLDFYFAYYSLYTYNSRPVDDYDFVFCGELRWVPFSDINSIEDKDKIDAVLNDNVLLKFTLEFILRVKKTDYYTKINDYKKFHKNNKLEFGAPKYFSTQWFNATDAITRSLIKWDVSTKPWDDVSDWQSHIAFQFQEYFFCIGQFHLKQEWSLSIYSRNDLKIYSLISLVEDNMIAFRNTYSLPKEVTEFIFNMIRSWINLLGISDEDNNT
jgi:serine/threonine protein kinase